MAMAERDDLTLVIDIGKSHAKLLMVDGAGTVVERHGRNNASVMSPLGYPALDVHGLEAWMAQTLSASTHTRYCSKVITSTHGAALVALGDEGLAWEPMDYEHDALAAFPQLAQAFTDASDPFDLSLSPALPAGLNAARQLFAVQHLYPQAWQDTRWVLPYPQYWAWLLCGVRASEYSSLGCHTHLWQPQLQDYSDLARAQGWVKLFPPMHAAWAALGTVLPHIVKRWGLPTHCVVYAGVHDSNACLARYLNASSEAAARLTVVSSGTWTVLMAPGAATTALQAERDMLANVDVLGRATPTARFMGGREFAHLLAGASPDADSVADVAHLLATQTLALPSFAAQGGPFSDRTGVVLQGDVPVALADLTEGERAALATLYCALVTRWLVRQLWPDETTCQATEQRLVVEGPLSRNPLYMGLLASLLPDIACYASVDELEGTARGAWQLTRWGQPADAAFLQEAIALELPALADYALAWQQRLGMEFS
jgi:sugar (pentulose or hexulose) kinase